MTLTKIQKEVLEALNVRTLTIFYYGKQWQKLSWNLTRISTIRSLEKRGLVKIVSENQRYEQDRGVELTELGKSIITSK